MEQQRKPYEESILKYMETVDEPCLNIKNGTLEIKVKEIKDAINEDIVKESVEASLKNNKIDNGKKIIDDVCVALQNKQTFKIKKQLARTRDKKKK